jgi:hypothetical protein
MARLVLLIAIASLVVAPMRADDAAIAIINTGIKAHGGEKALMKNKAGEYKMKGTMPFLDGDLPYTYTIAYQLPDKFKMTFDSLLVEQKLSMTGIGDGDKFKIVLNGKVQKNEDNTNDELRQGAASQEISMLYPLLDKEKYTIKSGEDAKIAGVECSTVLVEGKKTKPMKLYFEKKTGLLHATVRPRSAPPGGIHEVDEETVMSDYKEVEGVKVPMKLVMKHGNKPYMSSTVTEVKLSAKLDPKVFSLED